MASCVRAYGDGMLLCGMLLSRQQLARAWMGHCPLDERPSGCLGDVGAHVGGGPVEAVGVHELLPGERERLEEERVVEGEVRDDGAERLRVVGDAVLRHLGAVLQEQQVALLHEDLLPLRLELQLRVEDAVELEHLPLLRREHAEVLVRVRPAVGERVVRPGPRVAHGALLVGGPRAPLQRHQLAEGEPRPPPVVLQPGDVVREVPEHQRLQVLPVLPVRVVRPPGAEGDGGVAAVGVVRRLQHVRPRLHNQVRPGEAVPELVLHRLQDGGALVHHARVRPPALARVEADARAVAPAAVVRHAPRLRAVVRERHQQRLPPLLLHLRPRRLEQVVDRLLHVLLRRRVQRRRRQRVLELLHRGEVPGVEAAVVPQVLRGELVPRVGERLVEGVHVVRELLHQQLEARVADEGNVGGEHHGGLCVVDARGQVRERLDRARADGVVHVAVHAPLGQPALALLRDPLEVDQVLEVLVVPADGVGGPGALEPGGVDVLPDARAALSLPGVGGVDVGGVPAAVHAGAVRLAEGMPAAHQRHCLLVVEPLQRERDADVLRGVRRVRRAVHALRVRAQGAQDLRVQQGQHAGLIGERDLSAVGQDGRVVGIDLVHATCAEAQHRCAQHLERRVGREDDEIAP
mmetsp:Transcript_26910/g.58714  ORF Transcript_26910/g.58714 Transcript_26910/m.58714 type:complete len:633 (+) Transcript_26910:288-2186(+)